MRWFLCLMVVLLGGVASAETKVMTPQEVLDLAARSVATGRAELALALSNALLERDAEDAGALLVKAHALRALARVDEARDVSSDAWKLADSDRKKFAAALVQAQMLSSSGRRLQSQLWLRRAMQLAPTEEHRQQAIRDFRYVKSRNPWQVDLSFSVSPNSNINNGSRRTIGTLDPLGWGIEAMWQLSGRQLALSGTEIRSGLALRYRLQDRGAGGSTDLNLSATRHDFHLSDEAKEIAPEARGSDYAFSSTRIGFTHTESFQAIPGHLTFGTSFAQSRQGGEVYKNSGDVSVRVALPASERSGISGHLRLNRQAALTERTVDSHGWAGGLAWTALLGESSSRLVLGVNLDRSFSDANSLDWKGVGAHMGLSLGQPVMGARLRLGLFANKRRYDRGPVMGQGRQDRSLGASVTIEPDKFDLYGFVPRVTLSARQNDSDYGQYDTYEESVRFGFRSAF